MQYFGQIIKQKRTFAKWTPRFRSRIPLHLSAISSDYYRIDVVSHGSRNISRFEGIKLSKWFLHSPPWNSQLKMDIWKSPVTSYWHIQPLECTIFLSNNLQLSQQFTFFCTNLTGSWKTMQVNYAFDHVLQVVLNNFTYRASKRNACKYPGVLVNNHRCALTITRNELGSSRNLYCYEEPHRIPAPSLIFN